MTSHPAPHLVLVGSGGAALREYLLSELADVARITLLVTSPPTWQIPYVDRIIEIDPVGDLDSVVDELLADAPAGVVTWDESMLELTGHLTERLGLPGLTAASARLCRDKAAQRDRFAAQCVPSPRHALVRTSAEALAAATEIGFPVIVKPQALAGSIAVERVETADRLSSALEGALTASFPGFAAPGGAVIEELLIGTELSVDAWVLDGTVEPFVIAKKAVSDPPFFEEVRHEVGDGVVDVPDDLLEVTRAAVLALGLDRCVVHVEVMVTATGCKIVEVNGRLGGDLIPYLGALATGVRPGAVAGQVAMGVRPTAEPVRDPGARCAGIQFIYPERDLVFEDVEVDDALVDASWCESVRILGQLGMEARLPPRGFLARLACAVVVADTPAMLTERLNAAARGVRPVGRSL